MLADVLSYAVDEGADSIIDLATLTGGCVVALGEDIVGVFTNNQPWCDQVLAAAKRAGEDVWQLPTHDSFADLIKSDVADMENGRPAGGREQRPKFLERFVDKKPWVHLDIAGPAFAHSSKPHREGGGTGCMLRTLVEVATHPASDGPGAADAAQKLSANTRFSPRRQNPRLPCRPFVVSYHSPCGFGAAG